MAKYSDEQILNVLRSSGVPGDLPEVALSREPAPSLEALERIKQKTMSRVAASGAGSGVRKVPARRAGWLKYAVAAALAVAVTAAVWIGPATVWAGLRKAFSLVPGFGLFEHGRDEFTLIASERVRVEHGEGFIEVTGLLAQPECTYLNIYQIIRHPGARPEKDEELAERSWHLARERMNGIYLVDRDGQRYRQLQDPHVAHALGYDETVVAGLLFPPLDERTRQITVVIPLQGREGLQLEIPLVSLNEIEEWEEVAGAVTRQGITVSATARCGADTLLSLVIVPRDPAVRIDQVGRFFGGGIAASRPVVLAGANGREYDFLRFGQGWQPNYYELYFEGAEAGEQEVSLTVPLLLLREEAKARVTVPVPSGGAIELNRAVTLGRFSLTLTRVEVATYAYGDSLRVYVDLGPSGEETLESFTLQFRGSGGWMSKFNETTGRMEYFEVSLDGNPNQLKLTLKDPVYSVEGPWTFTFPVE